MLRPRPPAWLAAFAARIENGRLTVGTTRLHRHRRDAGDAGDRRAVGFRHGAVQRPGLAFHRTAHRGGRRWRGRAERRRWTGRARPTGSAPASPASLARGRHARRHDRQPRPEPGGAAAGAAGAVPRRWAADRRQRPGGGRRSGAGDRRFAGDRRGGAARRAAASGSTSRWRPAGSTWTPGCRCCCAPAPRSPASMCRSGSTSRPRQRRWAAARWSMCGRHST